MVLFFLLRRGTSVTVLHLFFSPLFSPITIHSTADLVAGPAAPQKTLLFDSIANGSDFMSGVHVGL
jgi:hypothetical protein